MKKQRTVLTLVAALFGLLLFWGVTMLQSSCSNTHEEVEQTDSVKIDLRVGVLPTLEALPIYYAQQAGICDSLGLRIEIHPYVAQFDCDTALLNNAVDVCMMDRTRFAHYKNQGHQLSAQLNINTRYALVVSKDLNANKVSDLNNRTIAVSRHSGAEAFSLHTLNSVGMKREDVHFPQINDIWLRADMLTNRQVDAASLPLLQAHWAVLQGHKILKSETALPAATMQLVYPNNSEKIKEINLLAKAYKLAEQQIKTNGIGVCRNILINEYKISASITDSLIVRDER